MGYHFGCKALFVSLSTTHRRPRLSSFTGADPTQCGGSDFSSADGGWQHAKLAENSVDTRTILQKMDDSTKLCLNLNQLRNRKGYLIITF